MHDVAELCIGNVVPVGAGGPVADLAPCLEIWHPRIHPAVPVDVSPDGPVADECDDPAWGSAVVDLKGHLHAALVTHQGVDLPGLCFQVPFVAGEAHCLLLVAQVVVHLGVPVVQDV